MDDRLLSLPAALGVDVVPLVFWLDGELPAQPEQPFALQLVVHKPFANPGDSDVGSQRGDHFFVPLAAPRRWRIKMRLKTTRGGSSRPSIRMPGLRCAVPPLARNALTNSRPRGRTPISAIMSA